MLNRCHRLLARRISGTSQTCRNLFLRDKHSSAELHDDSSRTITDFLTPNRVDLLNLTLEPYVPQHTIGTRADTLPPGFHFIFFPTSTSELETLQDGYEKHFAPKEPFKRRLWTQGTLDFRGEGLKLSEWAECVENLLRVEGGENKTDVWIERKMFNSSTSPEAENWSVKEIRCLRYLTDLSREPEESATSSSISAAHHNEPILEHRFTPTQILLTRFSYLTHNFHRIHIDQDYAGKVEGCPNTLVHGSLSITIILKVLQQFHNDSLAIRHARYVMYRPLYVDSPVRLLMYRTKPDRMRVRLLNSSNEKAVECSIWHD